MAGLIALLGNPGTQYARTRHNAAWLFSTHCGWDDLPWMAKWNAHLAEATIAGDRRTLVKPQQFMNRSGESIARIARFYRIERTGIVVVHDDVELAFGDVSWKDSGGLGGHNGLRSLADSLGGRDFRRLRIGVGRPARGAVASYVLSAFTRSEQADLPRVFDDALDLLEGHLRG